MLYVPQEFISMYLPAIYAGLIVGFIGTMAIAMKREEIHIRSVQKLLVQTQSTLSQLSCRLHQLMRLWLLNIQFEHLAEHLKELYMGRQDVYR